MYIDIQKCKIYKPTNDYMFGRIFGDKESSDILKDFLQAILPDIKISHIEPIKQSYIDRINPRKKFGRMDILATLNDGIKVNIEMQMDDHGNTISRSLYYLERLGSSDLSNKVDYNKIPRVISIWILDYNLFDDGTYHDVSRIRRDFNSKPLTNKLELHYIQLPKFKQNHSKVSTKLDQWLTFIINDNLEEIENMDNENIKKAQSKLEYLNDDDEARAMAEYLADAERNERSALSTATEKGRLEGKLEGRLEEKNEIIKKMLAKKFKPEEISELTNASIEEILDIKNNL